MRVVSTGRRFIWLSDLSNCIWTSVWPLIIRDPEQSSYCKEPICYMSLFKLFCSLWWKIWVHWNVPYFERTFLHPKWNVNGYADARKMWSSSCPAHCTCLTWRVFHTLCRFILMLKLSHVAGVLCKVLEASGQFLWK